MFIHTPLNEIIYENKYTQLPTKQMYDDDNMQRILIWKIVQYK